MNRNQFNGLIKSCRSQQPVKEGEISPAFGSATFQQIYKIGVYEIEFRDNKFFAVYDEHGYKINEEELPEQNFDGLSDDELSASIYEMEKELKQRKKQRARKALKDFETAWQALQEFEEVRFRVSILGKNQGHVGMNEIKLEALPF